MGIINEVANCEDSLSKLKSEKEITRIQQKNVMKAVKKLGVAGGTFLALSLAAWLATFLALPAIGFIAVSLTLVSAIAFNRFIDKVQEKEDLATKIKNIDGEILSIKRYEDSIINEYMGQKKSESGTSVSRTSKNLQDEEFMGLEK